VTPWLPIWLEEDVTTDIAKVDVSGWAILFADNVPAGVRVFVPVPTSEPFADAAELGIPPARTEPSEYIEETDVRLFSRSGTEGRGRRAGSGRQLYVLDSSAMLGIFGVSSIPQSSALVLRSSLHASVPVIEDALLCTD